MHSYKNVGTFQRFTYTALVQLFSSVPLDITREGFETEHLRYIRERHVSLGWILITAYKFVLNSIQNNYKTSILSEEHISADRIAVNASLSWIWC